MDTVNPPIESAGKAVEDLKLANELNVDVTAVQKIPPYLKKSVDVAPSEIVTDTANQSVQKASAIAPDAERLSGLEKWIKSTGMNFKSGDYNRKKSEMSMRISQMRQSGVEPTKEQLDEWDFYNLKAKSIEQDRKDLSQGDFAEAGTAIATSFRDMFKDTLAHPEIVGPSVTAGMMMGAAAGGPVPNPYFKGVTILGGAATGAGGAIQAAGFVEQSKRVFGDVYYELSNVKNPNGSPANLPEDLKNGIGWASGMMVAGVDLVGEELVFKTIPWLKGIASNEIGKTIAGEIVKPANRTLRQNLYVIGRALAFSSQAEGLSEVAQSLIQTNFTELAKSWQSPDGMDFGRFTKAMVELTITDPVKRNEFWDNLGEEYKIGALAGVGTSAIGNTGEIIETGKKINTKLGEGGSINIGGPIMKDGADFQNISNRIKKVQPSKVKIKDGSEIEIRAEMTSYAGLEPIDMGPDNTKAQAATAVAYKDGKVIGYATVAGHFEDGVFKTSVGEVQVTEEMRRKGVATNLYNFIDKKIAKLDGASELLSDDGKAFTSKYYAKKNKPPQFVIRDGSKVKLSPQAVQAEAVTKKASDILANAEKPKEPPTIVTDSNGVPIGIDTTKALNLAVALKTILGETEKFKIAGSPIDLNQIREKLIQQTGTKNFWVDVRELHDYAKTETEKATVAKILLTKEADVGGRVPLSIQEFLEVYAQNNKIVEKVSGLPADPTLHDIQLGLMAGKKQGADKLQKMTGAKHATEEAEVESTSPEYVYDGPDVHSMSEETTDKEIANAVTSLPDAEKALDELEREENLITGKGQLTFEGLPDPKVEALKPTSPKTYSRTVDVDVLGSDIVAELEVAKSKDDVKKVLQKYPENKSLTKFLKILQTSPYEATEINIDKDTLLSGARLTVKVPGATNADIAQFYRGFAGKADILMKAPKNDVEGNDNLTRGLFVTDAYDTAHSYAKMRAGPGKEPQVFRLEGQGKILDLSDKVPDVLLQLIKQRYEELQKKNSLSGDEKIEMYSSKRYIENAIKEDGTVDTSNKGANYTALPNMLVVKKYAQERGYIGLRFPDANPGESVTSVFLYDPKNVRYFDENGTETMSPENQQRLKDIARLKDGIKKLIPTLPEETKTPEPESKPEELTQIEEVQALMDDYVTAPIMTNMIAASMNPKDVVALHEDMLAIRQKIAAATQDAAKKEMDDVIDAVKELEYIEAAEQAAKDLVANPLSDKMEHWQGLKIKGENVQIDPKSLNDAQKAKYADSPTIKARKAFSSKGLPLKEVAVQFGLTPDDMLHMLDTVLTKTEAIDQAAKLKLQEVDAEIVEGVDPNTAAIVAALEDKQKMHLQEITMLAKMSYGKVRKAINNILTRTVDMHNLKAEAIDAIRRLKASELSWKHYERAGKIAARKAIKAATRGDFLEAARQREISIKADEYRKNAQVAIGRINRMMKFVLRKMRDKDLEHKLKQTGNKEAWDSLVGMFNLDPQAAADANGLAKFVERYINDDMGEVSLPADVLAMYNPKLTFADMSHDQIMGVYNLFRTIINDTEAKLEFQTAQGKVAHEIIADQVDKELLDHPDHNLDKTIIYGAHETKSWGKLVDWMMNAHAFMQNVNYTTKRLGQGKKDSVIVDLVYNQLAGVGNFAKSGFGEAANFQLRSDVLKLVNGIYDRYNYTKRSKELGMTRVSVPEFNGSVGLLDPDGKISLLQLLTMTGYAFNEKGRQRISNFGIDPNTVTEIAQRYLTERDMDFLQDITNIFITLQDRIQDTNKRLHGQEVDFVTGDKIKMFGKDYKIDYIPLVYRSEQNIDAEEKFYNKSLDAVLNDEFHGNIDMTDASRSMTREGYKEDRVNSSKAFLSLDFNVIIAGGLEDIINDVTMHVPIKNVMRIITDKKIKQSIIAVIGQEQYKTLVCNVLSTGKSAFADRIHLHSKMQNDLMHVFRVLAWRQAASTLIGVPSTVLAQGTSIVYMWSGFNTKAKFKYPLALASMLAQPWKWKAFMTVLGDLDPAFKSHLENIDEHNRGGVAKRLPKELSSSKITRGIQTMDEFLTGFFLGSVLGTTDMLIKGVGFIVQYQEFMDGKARGGLSKKELANMTPDQRHQAAHAHSFGKTRQLTTSSSTLEKAMFQKSGKFEGWVMFFNDLRNVYNMTMYTGDKAITDMKAGAKSIKAGDLKKGTGLMLGGAAALISLHLHTVMARAIMNAAQGRDEEGEELPAKFTHEWEKRMFEDAMWNFFNPFELVLPKVIVGSTPILRDILFSIESSVETGSFVSPYQWRTLSSLVDAFKAARQAVIDLEMSDAEQKKILKGAGSIITFPNRATQQYIDNAENPDWVDEFISDPGVIPMLPLILFMGVQNLIKTGNWKAAEKLETVRKTIDPHNVQTTTAINTGQVEPISAWDRRVIMMAESTGVSDAVNPDSGATGLYQFTAETWAGLMRNWPDSGLVASGRTDPEQQEIAMTLLMRETSTALVRAGLEVNRENIYILHHFGQGKGIRILNLDDDANLPNMDREREDNGWLDGHVQWVNNRTYVETVGQFKEGIRAILQKGQRDLLNTLE